jgi:hypothetical protein
LELHLRIIWLTQDSKELLSGSGSQQEKCMLLLGAPFLPGSGSQQEKMLLLGTPFPGSGSQQEKNTAPWNSVPRLRLPAGKNTASWNSVPRLRLPARKMHAAFGTPFPGSGSHQQKMLLLGTPFPGSSSQQEKNTASWNSVPRLRLSVRKMHAASWSSVSSPAPDLLLFTSRIGEVLFNPRGKFFSKGLANQSINQAHPCRVKYCSLCSDFATTNIGIILGIEAQGHQRLRLQKCCLMY